MKKIMILFGTRPEAIKLVPVIQELRKYPRTFKIVICVTAQHRQMLDQVLEPFSIRPDYDLNVMQVNQKLTELTANILLSMEEVLKKERPDLVLVQGDTTTTFVEALSAFYHKISVAHIEAGLRTYNKFHPYPEEINRQLVSTLADLHFAPTDLAKKNLMKGGIDKSKIFVTGNTIVDALYMISRKIHNVNFLKEIDFQNEKLLLITAHRRENFGRPLTEICRAIKEIVRNNPEVEVIYPVHLNPSVQKTARKILGGVERVHLIKPLAYIDFLYLMSKCYLILTDSGGIQEEAPSFGKPVLVLREVTERPEAIMIGTAKLVGSNRNNIVNQAEILLYNKTAYNKMIKRVNPYGDGKASKRIVSTLKRVLRE
ncbi:MAG: UDP-N-acetylglucosamine 2-epimerase (non-hydrolyzing) [Candidatus Omnitrophica bacterium]|nr:UDP-N-acetylglucosamine 2-epimerase (non-hydrolyzing) [Candidatus Omnitrophota bacterium]